MTDLASMFAPLEQGNRLSVAKDNDGLRIISPVPSGTPFTPPHHRAGKPSKVFPYFNGKGELLCAVARFDTAPGEKTFAPVCFCEDANGNKRWHYKALSEPRPLYGLDRLDSSPDSPVLVVEGEKAADAAARSFPHVAVVTSPHGARAAGKADWSPLKGRRVILWPDNDAEGKAYAIDVAASLSGVGCQSVSMVVVPEAYPEKWDLADEPPPGVTHRELSALLDTAGAVPVSGPDMAVLKQGRRPAPKMPLEVFGPWQEWIEATAEGAGSPADYVAAALLGALAALIGNAREAAVWNGWSEPSILWLGCIGDPSSGKSPGADVAVAALREVESELAEGFDDDHRRWEGAAEVAKAADKAWRDSVEKAVRDGNAPAEKPLSAMLPAEPVRPRIVVNDSTPEALALILKANDRGLLLRRDELAGWIGGMDQYKGGGAGRAFWIECFGARPFVIDRVKHGAEVRIERLSVSVLGNIQPDKLATLLGGDDDGLAARFLWLWPEAVPPRRPSKAGDRDFAISGFRRLARLVMGADIKGANAPVAIPLTEEAATAFQEWRLTHHQDLQAGKLPAAFGKMPGLIVRLALVLEFAWWAAEGGPEPANVSLAALAAAAEMVEVYWKPMAVRVYGDAVSTLAERNAATLAAWIVRVRATEINVRVIARDVRLPGLRKHEAVEAAVNLLVEARWLTKDHKSAVGRPGNSYRVNPAVLES